MKAQRMCRLLQSRIRMLHQHERFVGRLSAYGRVVSATLGSHGDDQSSVHGGEDGAGGRGPCPWQQTFIVGSKDPFPDLVQDALDIHVHTGNWTTLKG